MSRTPTLLFVAALAVGCMPKSGSEPSAGAKAQPFSDDFERAAIGDKYKKTGGTWRLEGGALHSDGTSDHNAPLWLDHPLSKNVKVEFTAWSTHPAVDTKIEIFGDGLRHESGYIVIMAGWNNQISTIARLDEHEKTRVETRTRFEKGRKYKWLVQRTDGKTLEFFIDGKKIVEYVDSDPLFGPRNNKLGFTNWESQPFYDDLKITPLP
jgi:hypothetical protein